MQIHLDIVLAFIVRSPLDFSFHDHWLQFCVYFSPPACVPFTPWYEGWNFSSGNYLFTTDTK